MATTVRTSTTGKTIEALKRRFRTRNRRFTKLTKAGKRIAIAQDVIAQLQAKKLIACSTYLAFEATKSGFDEDGENINDILDRLTDDQRAIDMSTLTAQNTCMVCGIGSLFVAGVEFSNKLGAQEFGVAVDTHDNQAAIQDYLQQWFSIEQLELIEAVFEGYESFTLLPGNYLHPMRNEEDQKVRLTMIMENIVANRGTFNPYKGPHSMSKSRNHQ